MVLLVLDGLILFSEATRFTILQVKTRKKKADIHRSARDSIS